MNRQSDFTFKTGAPDTDWLRAFDADFTPTPVVVQYLTILRDNCHIRPERILDPAAGGGVFGRVARAVWPNAHIEGIEPRGDEIGHLASHYDLVHCCTFSQAIESRLLSCPPGSTVPKFDLIVTNPPFSMWRDFVPASLQLIYDGWLAFLGLTSWGSRSQDGFDLFESSPPVSQSRIPGTIGFRGPGVNPRTGNKWGADTRDYCWWSWHLESGKRKPAFISPHERWACENLPRLAGHERRWIVKPGTE